MSAKPMIKEVVTQWEQYGDESACPYCGTPNMTARTGFDEWADEDGRWASFRWQCDKCGGEWWSTYGMSCAGLQPAGQSFQTGCQNPAKSAAAGAMAPLVETPGEPERRRLFELGA